MMFNYRKIASLIVLTCAVTGLSAQNTPLRRNVGPQKDNTVLVPSNQLISPAGEQVYLPGRPGGLALIRNGKYLLVKNIHSLDLVRLEDRSVVQSLHFPKGGSSFNGLCTSGDESTIYLTEANDRVLVAGLDKDNTLSWRSPVLLPKPSIGGDPVPGGVVITQASNKLMVTCSRSNTLAVVSLSDSSVAEIPVGMVPYGVILKSDAKAYVSNWGGRRPGAGEPAYNSSGSQVLVSPVNGVASSGSVTVVDLDKKTRTREIEVGLHPSAMALNPDKSLLYVACANSDVITVINTLTDEVADRISVHQGKDTLFGSAPNALALSPDGKLLYVANGTENAVCVIETGAPYSILGWIPTGWYPGTVLTDAAGATLYVANIKGIGSRNKKASAKGYGSHDFMGSLSIIRTPSGKVLGAMTETVKRNNGFGQDQEDQADRLSRLATVPVPQRPGQTSPIKHVLYIIKENRMYDQMLGDLPQGNGDTSLVLFGREVTPNHHKLAESFVLLDNFYCSGVLSADGHQWATEAYATDYLEKSFGGFTRSYPFDGDDALAYAGTGFLWDNVLRHGLSFRDYGEFVKGSVLPAHSTFMDVYTDYKNGLKKTRIKALATIDQLKPFVCPSFVGFPNTVPDVCRADEFIKELHAFEKTDSFPNFMVMLLPNDHTSGTVPGMPTPKASVADNDLALGKIVEAVSHSKFWKETCIFVTEDDSQDGMDHVDGHRTVGFAISPYTKRNKTVSTYYSQVSMVRTIENILGLPPMNRIDRASGDMSGCFTVTPDFTPYTAEMNKIPLDQLNPPLKALRGKKKYWALKSLQQDLDDYDRVDETTFNRIIWHSVKGYDRPYPLLRR
jgi:DNA-binding beta-propeller fold protein YncE